jgi:hypothetical protein
VCALPILASGDQLVVRFVVAGNQDGWNAATGENVDAVRDVPPDARKIARPHNDVSVARQFDDPGRRRLVPVKIAKEN